MRTTNATFCERLHTPTRWWLQGGLLVASFWLAMIVAIPERAVWTITAALMGLLALGLWMYGRAKIVVGDVQLRAGRANIDLKFVGPAQLLDRTQARAVSGPLADARAYLLLRPYLSQAVRIEIEDPDDPTPYWLVASRRAELLTTSLNEARARTAVDRQTGDSDLRRQGELPWV